MRKIFKITIIIGAIAILLLGLLFATVIIRDSMSDDLTEEGFEKDYTELQQVVDNINSGKWIGQLYYPDESKTLELQLPIWYRHLAVSGKIYYSKTDEGLVVVFPQSFDIEYLYFAYVYTSFDDINEQGIYVIYKDTLWLKGKYRLSNPNIKLQDHWYMSMGVG